MDNSDFHHDSTQALEHIEESLANLEDERLDVQLAGDVLTLTFWDGTRFVINAHSAAKQIWMAAGTTAWHFDYQQATDTWIANRSNDELMETVARTVGEKLASKISL